MVLLTSRGSGSTKPQKKNYTTTVRGAVSCVNEFPTTEVCGCPVEWENGNTKSKCEFNEIPYHYWGLFLPSRWTKLEFCLFCSFRSLFTEWLEFRHVHTYSSSYWIEFRRSSRWKRVVTEAIRERNYLCSEDDVFKMLDILCENGLSDSDQMAEQRLYCHICFLCKIISMFSWSHDS